MKVICIHTYGSVCTYGGMRVKLSQKSVSQNKEQNLSSSNMDKRWAHIFIYDFPHPHLIKYYIIAVFGNLMKKRDYYSYPNHFQSG